MIPWKILFLFVVLDIRHDDILIDCRQLCVHLHDLSYLDHVLHPALGSEYLKLIKMSNTVSSILGRQVDPGETLSNKDLLQLLLNDSTSKVRDLEINIKENLDLDREHNKKVVEKVVTGLCNRINNFEEFTITSKNDLADSLKDLDLKLTTLCSYQEQLIDKLSNKVYDLTAQLQAHEKTCKSTMDNISCKECNSAFLSLDDYNNHALQHHTMSSNYPCTQVFMTMQCLSGHLNECTQVIQFLQPSNLIPGQTLSQCTPEKVQDSMSEIIECSVCGHMIPCGHDLQTHMIQSHGWSFGNFSNNQEVSQVFHPSFPCNYCATNFETQLHLEEHISEVHYPPVSQAISSLPSILFPSPDLNLAIDCDDPANHKTNEHVVTLVDIHCHFCESTFKDMRSLNIHTAASHTAEPEINCGECSETTSFLSEELLHLSSVHNDLCQVPSPVPNNSYSAAPDDIIPQYDGNDTTSSSDTMSDILQVDGIDDIPISNTPNAPTALKTRSTDVLTRVANFELNRAKQTAGIYRDAQVQDYKVVHKDNDKNINIECSSGFYSQVAKPTLCSLSQDYIQPILGFSVTCDRITENTDALGHEVNLTMFFKISQSSGNNAKVTVHVHNSTRLVQVQGGSVMPDKSTSALWFVKNVLSGKFYTLAKAKSLNIARFNDAVTDMARSVEKPDDRNCGLCELLFDSRSKPVYCVRCVKWFHKTNCYRGHRCSTRPQSSSSITPLSSVASSAIDSSVYSLNTHHQPLLVPSSHVPSSGASAPSLTLPTTSCVPATSYSDTIAMSVALPITSVTTVASVSSSSFPATITSSLSSVMVTTTSISAAIQNPELPHIHPPNPPPQTRRQRMTQNISNFTPEKAEIESLKIELGYARTKITDLQSKIDDRDQTINIYSQKIKLLEGARANSLQEKYFSSSQPPSNPSPADMSLSMDCSCKIRAQISKNAANLTDMNSKFVSVVQNIDKKLDVLTSKPGYSSSAPATSATQPSSLPRASPPQKSNITADNSLQSSFHSPRHHSPSQIPDFNFHCGPEKNTETSLFNESEFDFSESFAAPESSPKVNLN